MPIKKTSTFVKNETDFNFSKKYPTNYTGVGVKVVLPESGTIESMSAFKVTENSRGGFAELKYTSPKFTNSNIAFESRTRLMTDVTNNKNNIYNMNANQRFALKYSQDFSKLNVYEILGSSATLSLKQGNFTKITPTSITGVGVNIYKNLSMYLELELSKSYQIEPKQWDKLSSGVNIGFKATF